MNLSKMEFMSSGKGRFRTFRQRQASQCEALLLHVSCSDQFNLLETEKILVNLFNDLLRLHMETEMERNRSFEQLHC